MLQDKDIKQRTIISFNVRLKPSNLRNICWKDHYSMAALKTHSVLCTGGQWKQAMLRQTWSVNTFSKKIHVHFAMHSTAERSVSKLLHLSIFSSYQIVPLGISQSVERQWNSPWTVTVPSSNYCWLNRHWQEWEKQLAVFVYTGKLT